MKQKTRTFKKDLGALYPNTNSREIFTENTKDISPNQGIYFVSKWYEVLNRYQTARNFFSILNSGDYGDRIKNIENKRVKEFNELKYNIDIYETALINYNIVVDLSWTMVYVCAEFAHYQTNKQGEIKKVQEISTYVEIEEAYKNMRISEQNVQNPDAEGNPFDYFKKIAPLFSIPIHLIIDFWCQFRNSDIRKNYNYIKHRGRPEYTELDNWAGEQQFYIKFKDMTLVSDIRDIQIKIQLESEIEKLFEFDNNILFPYVQKLIHSLDEIIRPSPFIV